MRRSLDKCGDTLEIAAILAGLAFATAFWKWDATMPAKVMSIAAWYLAYVSISHFNFAIRRSTYETAKRIALLQVSSFKSDVLTEKEYLEKIENNIQILNAETSHMFPNYTLIATITFFLEFGGGYAAFKFLF